MQQASAGAAGGEDGGVAGPVDVGAEGLTQVGVEVDEASAVDDDVEVAVQTGGLLLILEAEVGEGDVALDDLDAAGDERGHVGAVQLV